MRRERARRSSGAGASEHLFPLSAELARRWAEEHRYPLDDRADLARVAQFIGVTSDDLMLPKELMKAVLDGAARTTRPDSNVHAGLARLPLPVYITTNYDNLTFEALVNEGKRPRREVCHWNESPAMAALARGPGGEEFVPELATPLVFHLHGNTEVSESMVLTEDDYLDFLACPSPETRNSFPIKSGVRSRGRRCCSSATGWRTGTSA